MIFDLSNDLELEDMEAPTPKGLMFLLLNLVKVFAIMAIKSSSTFSSTSSTSTFNCLHSRSSARIDEDSSSVEIDVKDPELLISDVFKDNLSFASLSEFTLYLVFCS